MPKDKTVTYAKIIECMREEFLTYGYEKASLNRISEKVGITTAGLYKHFRGKEDMFGFLVRDTLDDFKRMETGSTAQMSGDVEQYSPFREEFMLPLVELIYDHYEGVKLLICCAEGSRYASFEEDLVKAEEESNKQHAAILAQSGHQVKLLTDMQWHLLSTEYIHLVFEMVRHDLPKEEAYRHMEFVRSLLYPGWKEIFGLS